MKIEQHEQAYKEHLENLKRQIEEGIENNQRNIGYNLSQGSVELFAIYMHKLNLLQSSGDQFDHRIFKSKNLIKSKIPFEFPLKNKILELMKLIEEERSALCYGARKPKTRVERALKYFHDLRRIVNKEIENAKQK